jgi:hypothetical protein
VQQWLSLEQQLSSLWVLEGIGVGICAEVDGELCSLFFTECRQESLSELSCAATDILSANAVVPAMTLIADVSAMVELATTLLKGPQCQFVSQAVNNINDNVCGLMYYSIPSVGLISFIIALMLAVTYPIALLASKRFVSEYHRLDFELVSLQLEHDYILIPTSTASNNLLERRCSMCSSIIESCHRNPNDTPLRRI